MTAEAQSTPSSRRAVLAAGVGALVALVAQALGRPSLARANNGDPVLAGNGGTLAASATTGVTTTSGIGVYGESSAASSAGVRGRATGGQIFGAPFGAAGVEGLAAGSAQHGVRGRGPTGVYGGEGAVGVWGEGSQIGLFGEASGSSVAIQARSIGTSPAAVFASTSGRTGSYGYSGPTEPVPAAPPSTGLYGRADRGEDSRGVTGEVTAGRGVEGKATTGSGVWGESNATAIVGKSDGSSTGVLGFSGSASDVLPGAASKTGVFGFARQDASSIGVYGNSSFGRGVLGEAGAGRGVHGWSNTGVGVRAEAAAGTALQVAGRASFSRSGRLTIAAGRSSVTKTGITPLTSASLVLAVLQSNRTGIYVRAVVPSVAGHSFTIYLNKAVAATTYVAWFILN
jgi:hypothetical protein